MSAVRSRVRSGGTGVEGPAPSSGHVVGSPVTTPAVSVPIVRERRLRRVLEKIENQSPHSVRELAQEVHLSPAHLQRLFKQETGVHLSDLLSEHRLQKAAYLLSSTDMEVKEIAYLVGYGHHSSFVRAFQRRFRKSPRNYRQSVA